MTWKKVSSQEVYKNRYMTVTDEKLITNHGDEVQFGIVHKKPFVVVIPWDGSKILLVGQYRYAIDYFSWEFPMGHTEGIDPTEAALMELKQESGLIGSDPTAIGTFCPAPGHLDQTGYVYVVTKWEVGKQELEPSEKGMEVKWVTMSELKTLIKDGTIKDGPTITAFQLFELYLDEKVC
jgi:8-oxo-dGDP phosphatase